MDQANNWQWAVEMVRRTVTRRGRAKSGYFSIEGIRLHERALRAGIEIELAITTEGFKQDSGSRSQKLFADMQLRGCQVEVVPDDVIKDIVGERDLGQILGLIKMPQQRRLIDILHGGIRPLLLVAVDVKDPGNVGAMLRTAHAAGATAFAATGISDPFHPKALRTTMGSLFRLPVFYFEDVLELIGQLQELDISTVGTAAVGGNLLPQAEFSESGAAVLMGSEAWGLTEEVMTAVDQLVTIPMGEEVDSFSVNAAAAIILYDIGRKWA